MEKKKNRLYYFQCLKCRFVLRSQFSVYQSSCPICRGYMERSVVAETLARINPKKGGVNHA